MSLLNGIGAVLGKAADWIPGKKESYKNEIESIKREMEKLQSKRPYTTNDSLRYYALSDKLRSIEAKYKNI